VYLTEFEVRFKSANEVKAKIIEFEEPFVLVSAQPNQHPSTTHLFQSSLQSTQAAQPTNASYIASFTRSCFGLVYFVLQYTFLYIWILLVVGSVLIILIFAYSVYINFKSGCVSPRPSCWIMCSNETEIKCGDPWAVSTLFFNFKNRVTGGFCDMIKKIIDTRCF